MSTGLNESWDAVRKKAKEVADKRAASGSGGGTGGRLGYLSLKEDGTTAKIQFVTSPPICVYQHQIKVGHRWPTFTCVADNPSFPKCHFCERGNTPRFFGYFIVWVHEILGPPKVLPNGELEKNADGTVKREVLDTNKPMILQQGLKVLKSLEKLNAKPGGLMEYVFEMTRVGTGLETTYNFDTVGPKHEIPEEVQNQVIDLHKVVAPKSEEVVKEVLGLGDGDMSTPDDSNEEVKF